MSYDPYSDPHSLMAPTEVAQMLAVAPKTLERWRYEKVGPPYLKLGNTVRYKRADVIAHLEGCKSE